jgi:hypothetical protein
MDKLGPWAIELGYPLGACRTGVAEELHPLEMRAC